MRAVAGAVSGTLADQWLEVIEPKDMGEGTVLTSGVKVRREDGRNRNRKGTEHTISNDSVIHVYKNQFMMLVDGGKIIDYTAEEGYYTVNSSSMPSMFNGELEESVLDSFNRVRFGGTTPVSQKVYYINLQEIKGIKFGTRNPINYFDNFYNAELFLRTHGTYSIKIVDPIRFYAEAVPKNRDQVEIGDINEQYMAEFLEALQAAVNQMSADGVRISFVTSKARELGKYMAGILDEDWRQMRGMEIQSVGLASISYDEESQKLINMRNQGAMLSDPAVREGYVQGALARGMEAAGSNANGSMAGFMGMGVGMQTAGSYMAAASQMNYQQMQMNSQQVQAAAKAVPAPEEKDTWTCACGSVNTGAFCPECGTKRPENKVAGSWVCACGSVNTGKFCPECGAKKPASKKIVCDKCGYAPDMSRPIPKFCPECGDPINDADIQEE